MRVVLFFGLVGVFMAVGFADVANAGVASTAAEPDCTDCKYGSTFHLRATYQAAPTETNTVLLRRTGDELTIRDETAPVTAGSGCTARNEREVTCSLTSACCRGAGARAEIDAGDGDDRVSVEDGSEPLGLLIDGGTGGDVLTAGASYGTLVGGDGVDTLTGGPGSDTLVDDGSGERDAFAGGGGRDQVSYEERSLRISLRIGAGDFEDSLDSIEAVIGSGADDVFVGDAGRDSFDGAGGADRVSGGRGADRLAGGAGADRVRGGRGADRLAGGAGKDRISGGPGADKLDGGAGADRLRGGSGPDTLSLGKTTFFDETEDDDDASDSIACGPGRDTVTDSGFQDLVPPDCERVVLGEALDVIGRLRRAAGTVRVRCVLTTKFDPDFPVRLELHRSRKLLGMSAPLRRTGRLDIRLNPIGRRIVRRGTRVVVRESFGGLKYATRVR